jgi:hypothetical protein
MTSLLGLDLNGFWDFVAEGTDVGEVVLKDLGVHGSFIRIVVDPAKWVGGSQAALAPHGKGPGWGKIGASENRISIQEMLDGLISAESRAEHVAAMSDVLASFADDVRSMVVAVPDVPTFDEAAQDRYLRLLRSSSRTRSSLLWRPMAAILGWLQDKATARGISLTDGMRLGILSFTGTGVQVADAKLIRMNHNGTDLWVPERSKVGLEATGIWSQRHGIQVAAEAMARQLGIDTNSVLGAINAPWREGVGLSPMFELARLPNRTWQRVPKVPLPTTTLDPEDLPQAMRERLQDIDCLLIEGPSSKNRPLVEAVLGAIGRSANLAHYVAPQGAVARGCLEAASRAQAGVPVYYDFLPQLEINALVKDQPQFVELIPKDQRLLGGTVYEGMAPADFAIGKGATSLTFYLFKEGFPNGRKAEVPLPYRANDQHRIRVSVEQSPGQGFARVRIGSDSFEAIRQRPLDLDWSLMEIVNDTRQEILAALEKRSGLTYPDTVIHLGHPLHWHPSHRAGNLIEQLEDYCRQPLFNGTSINQDAHAALKTLRGRFSRAENPAFVARNMDIVCEDLGSYRALSSDGSLPQASGDIEVPFVASKLLKAALSKAAGELDQMVSLWGLNANPSLVGDLIGFSSWCFWACPPSITSFLFQVYEGIFDFPVNSTMLREGVGRVIHEQDQVRRYFLAIDAKLAANDALKASEFAALGRVLGGCPDAANHLPPRTADRILQETCNHLVEENEKPREEAYKRKFKFALLMLAALLRHRCVRANFLDPEHRAAQHLLEILNEAVNRIRQFWQKEHRKAENSSGQVRASHLAAERRLGLNSEVVRELINLINREGSDPNIIRKIEEMDE